MRGLRERLRAPRAEANEGGFTLIELLIYSALLLLVVSLVGSIMISGITNQAKITNSTKSTTDSQVAIESIGLGVRNATSLTSPTLARPLLVVQTYGRGAAANQVCQAWFYSAAEHSIRTTTTPVRTKIGLPTAAQLRTWILVAEDVFPVDSTTAIFTTSGRTVTLSFATEGEAGSRQIVRTDLASRQPNPGSGATECAV